jgi:uncharacterized protein YcnI
MIKKVMVSLAIAGVVVGVVTGLSTGVASAHVVVKPAQAGVASSQIFTTSVPNEKDVAVTKMRLVIPAGLTEVSPNVKPGWTIEEVKDGTGEDAVVKEITWSGGTIPAGQRDDFAFSAQVPAKPTTIQWKAYQTYADGTEVAWDQKPTGSDDASGNSGPYSQTKVVNDLSQPAASSTAAPTQPASSSRTNLAIALSVVALLFSFWAYTSSRTAKTTKASADETK